LYRRPVAEQPSPPPPVVPRYAYFVAFLAVVVGGLSGAAIGYGLVAIDCDTGGAAGADEDCGTAQGVAALIGGLVGAAGVAVVAVLVLRALAEWRLGGGRRDPMRRT
jgi:hypothetical protein